MNYTMLVGRVTRDLILRNIESGNDVVNFTIAVTRNYKNKDGEYDTDFINCVAWNKIASTACDYIKKGDLIGIKGSLQTKNMTTADGTKYTATELLAEKITFLDMSKTIDYSNEKKIRI